MPPLLRGVGAPTLAIGSPRGMQTEQQGRTDAVPAARYTVSRAVIHTTAARRRRKAVVKG